jgi:RNA polymerase sigma-70 factor (ECF subfamily)
MNNSALPSAASDATADVAEPAAIAAIAALARSARAGDRDAFESLHARYARPVRALLLAWAGARDVDDLLQETFLQAWRARAALREPERYAAWLFAIGRSVARRPRRGADAGATSLPDELAAPGAERAAARAAESAEVLAALQSLPESYRETLALRLIEGFNGPEIAALTGLTHGSVRVNLHRGFERLREVLRERGLEP